MQGKNTVIGNPLQPDSYAFLMPTSSVVCCTKFSFFQIFEKVLVQNVLFGMSPSFTNALQNTPRWRFIVATLPHVMHCASSMLQYR